MPVWINLLQPKAGRDKCLCGKSPEWHFLNGLPENKPSYLARARWDRVPRPYYPEGA